MEEAHFTYSTKPATCNLDHFMHFVKTKAENLKVVLAESPKYVGLQILGRWVRENLDLELSSDAGHYCHQVRGVGQQLRAHVLLHGPGGPAAGDTGDAHSAQRGDGET